MIEIRKIEWVLLLICMAVTACRRIEADKSFLYGQPCPLPCWQTITPGKTDEATALTVLGNPDLVEPSSLVEKVPNEYSFRLIQGGSGNVGVQQGLVAYIRLNVSNDFYISLNELVNVLGQPGTVYIKFDLPPHGGEACYVVELLYPVRRIYGRINCNEPENASEAAGMGVTLDPGAKVDMLLLWSPAAYESANLRELALHSDPWRGFVFYPAKE